MRTCEYTIFSCSPEKTPESEVSEFAETWRCSANSSSVASLIQKESQSECGTQEVMQINTVLSEETVLTHNSRQCHIHPTAHRYSCAICMSLLSNILENQQVECEAMTTARVNIQSLCY